MTSLIYGIQKKKETERQIDTNNILMVTREEKVEGGDKIGEGD